MPSSKETTKGLFMCFTGNGKGKTTAALGSMIRAYGQGLKVIMFQFIKAKETMFGEHLAAKEIGLEIVPLGDGFTWKSEDIEKDRKYAIQCWETCKDKILNSNYDMIILDEITYPIMFNWLDLEEVVSTIRLRPKWMHVIVTGRNAPDRIIEEADLVTEMVEVKHHYRKKVQGQVGIEY